MELEQYISRELKVDTKSLEEIKLLDQMTELKDRDEIISNFRQDGMGYWKHLICQLCIIWTLFKMITAMFIHGLLPRCFPTYFADELKKLHKRWIHDEWIKESKNEEG